MIKNKFLYNISYLLSSGLLVKVMGLANKIILVRVLGLLGMGIYSLVIPTMMVFITIAEFGFPQSIGKVISERVAQKPYSNRGIIKKSLKLAFFLCVSLVIVLLVIIKPLITHCFHDTKLYYPMLTIIPIIPLVSLTGILKGYFIGHQRMDITSKAVIIEQVVRISTSILIVLLLNKYGVVMTVVFSLLTISLGEASSLIYMLLKLRKITSISLHGKSSPMNDVLDIAIPSTMNRLTYAISNFLEPIIFTAALMSIGLNAQIAQAAFATISGYVIPLLLIFSFISYSIDMTILPLLSSSLKNRKRFVGIISSSLRLNLITGGIITVCLMFFAPHLMNLLFDTTIGSNYVLQTAPIFLLYYFQGVLHLCLEVIGKAKITFYINLVLCVIKLILIYLLTRITWINVDGLLLAILINILLTTLIYYLLVRKYTEYRISIKGLFKGLITIILTFILGKVLLTTRAYWVYSLGLITVFYVSFVLLLYRKKDFSELLLVDN